MSFRTHCISRKIAKTTPNKVTCTQSITTINNDIEAPFKTSEKQSPLVVRNSANDSNSRTAESALPIEAVSERDTNWSQRRPITRATQ